MLFILRREVFYGVPLGRYVYVAIFLKHKFHRIKGAYCIEEKEQYLG